MTIVAVRCRLLPRDEPASRDGEADVSRLPGRSSPCVARAVFAAAALLVPVAIPGSAVAAGVPRGAAAAEPLDEPNPAWVLPVQRSVVDHFRPPATRWGAGNRGWEFATVDGDPVVAVGGGIVAFSGWVGGRGVVTLDHGEASFRASRAWPWCRC
ncbi:MAG: M23 family metallopeptidase [Microthrixaceae bacterium]|nr:M23 family metallopeptidase [Microthrixaceae bacterium]